MSFQRICIGVLILIMLPVLAHSTDSWRVLYDQGIQYQKAKRIDSAIISLKAALDSAHAKYGSVDSSSAMIMHRLGLAKFTISLDSGLVYWHQALAVWEKLPSPNPLEVGKTLNNLGSSYLTLERYDKALGYARRAFEIKRKLVSEDDSSLASPLSNLGYIYTALDSIEQAEQALLQSLAIRSRINGDTSITLWTTLTGLGDIYMRTLRFEKAAPYMLQAMRNFQRDVNLDGYYGTMANLAHCYSLMGKVDTADMMFDISLAYFASGAHTTPRNVFMIMSSAGRHWQSTRRYSKASFWLGKAQELCDAQLADQPGLRSSVDYDLALVLRGEGKYDEATRLLQSSIKTAVPIYGRDNLEVALRRRALAQTYLLQGRNRLALDQLDSCVHSLQAFEGPGLMAMSERDALQTEHLLYLAVDDYLNAYFVTGDESQASEVASAVLSTKGQVTDMIWKRHQGTLELRDTAQAALMQQLVETRSKVSRAFTSNSPNQSATDRERIVDSLNTLVEHLESEFALHSTAFRDSREDAAISSAKLSDLLPDSSVLIDYFRYSRFVSDSVGSKPAYAAIVIAKPHLFNIVSLGDADSIDVSVERYRQHMIRLAAARKLPSQNDRAEYAGLALRLYKSVFQPLEPFLGTGRQVMIAPDAALSYISFAGLLNNSGLYLTEQYKLHYLSAGRDLIRLATDSASRNSGLLAMGDPNYNATIEQRKSLTAQSLTEISAEDVSEDQYSISALRSACGNIQSLNVDSLPRTRTEVNAVARKWEKEYHNKPSTYLGVAATEDQFKDGCSSKRAIHLATHGYLLEDNCSETLGLRAANDSTSLNQTDPMLYSGLLFAGANLHGEGVDSANLDDGFLSAEEVLSLNLRGTDLVVLSACETGLGEIRRGEGVFGLKRAFEIAGARTVVSSLWQIPDQSNAEIMSALYSKSGGAMPERIQKFQLDQIRKLRAAGFTDHPFSWAAFIAQGDWRN